MIVKELFDNRYNADIYDDYDGRCQICYAGEQLTPEGIKEYSDVLNMHAKISVCKNYLIVILQDCTAVSAQRAADLFNIIAGHCTPEEYKRIVQEEI